MLAREILVEKMLEQLKDLQRIPIAIEAQWDGDTNGWGLDIWAVFNPLEGQSRKYSDSAHLGFLRGDGGDFRLFAGAVPPYPEAKLAAEVGADIAAQFGIPFYFPSPDYPEDECPHWWQRDQGYPCRICGIPLLQDNKRPWHGMCYHCHIDEEFRKKSSK